MSTKKFNLLPRADSFVAMNKHCIYRVFEIPGIENSPTYEGSGVEKTFDICEADKFDDYPPDEDAVPVLPRRRRRNELKASQMMRKDVKEVTAMCPECDVAGVVDEQKKERFCPECGLLLGRGDEIDSSNLDITPHLSRTPKAAGSSNYHTKGAKG